MKTRYKRSYSGTRRTYSSDNEPLSSKILRKRKKSRVTKNNVRTEICSYKCDFCNEVFDNKFSHLIHSANHIIIPVIKQEVHQCSECLFCFTSLNSFQEHITNKHPKTIDDNNFGNSLDVSVEVNHEIKKEPIIPPVEIKTEYENVPKCDIVPIKNRIIFEQDDDDDDELLSDDLLNDLKTECEVNLELFDAPLYNLNDDIENSVVGNGVQDLNGKDFVKTDANILEETLQPVNIETKKIEGTEEEEYTASVHYSQLIRPGLFRCKRCQKMFPNRFELIQHDTTHMEAKNTRPMLCNICERYIAGSGRTLHRHIVTAHPKRVYKRKPLSWCQKCGLKYANYDAHCINYHNCYPCNICGKFVEAEFIVLHTREHVGDAPQDVGENSANWHQNNVANAFSHDVGENSANWHQNNVTNAFCHDVGENSASWHQNSVEGAISLQNPQTTELKLCDVCVMFVYNRGEYMHTVKVDIKNGNNEKLKCDDCKKMCDNLTLVIRPKRHYIPRNTGKKKKKPLSNKDRLKNIQSRLKLFKQINSYKK